MHFLNLVFLLLGLPVIVLATNCAVDGSSWVYQETISGSDREIYTNMCPNHYSGCQKRECDGTTSQAIEKPTTWTIPAYPVIGTSTYWFDVECVGGTTGVALNGVNIYSQFDGNLNGCGDAISSESSTFDLCGGHADFSDYYHYHIPPTCLIEQLGDMPDGHSPQIGWAIDGFPIYGPKGPNGVDMYPCTHANADSTYCLDDCNGYEGTLSGIDEFLYRYYSTGPRGDLTCSATVENSDRGACDGQGNCCINIVPDTSYNPYTMACLKGCRNNNPGCLNRGKKGYTYTTASVSSHPDSVFDVFAPTLTLHRGESSSTLRLNMSSLDYDLIEGIYCKAITSILEMEEGDDWTCISSSISLNEVGASAFRRALTFFRGDNFMRKETGTSTDIDVSITLEGRGSVRPEDVLTNQTRVEDALEDAFDAQNLGDALVSVLTTSWTEDTQSDDGSKDDDDDSGMLLGKEGMVVGGVVVVGVGLLGVFMWRRRSKEEKYSQHSELLLDGRIN